MSPNAWGRCWITCLAVFQTWCCWTMSHLSCGPKCSLSVVSGICNRDQRREDGLLIYASQKYQPISNAAMWLSFFAAACSSASSACAWAVPNSCCNFRDPSGLRGALLGPSVWHFCELIGHCQNFASRCCSDDVQNSFRREFAAASPEALSTAVFADESWYLPHWWAQLCFCRADQSWTRLNHSAEAPKTA